ncbi:hypothetical protein BJX61DRAFT_542784 [Aspergillus egyptiacus]|nr:hypothetical protein BJX61DRAFT_542784 [Aspergillus egyptiacus]
MDASAPSFVPSTHAPAPTPLTPTDDDLPQPFLQESSLLAELNALTAEEETHTPTLRETRHKILDSLLALGRTLDSTTLPHLNRDQLEAFGVEPGTVRNIWTRKLGEKLGFDREFFKPLAVSLEERHGIIPGQGKFLPPLERAGDEPKLGSELEPVPEHEHEHEAMGQPQAHPQPEMDLNMDMTTLVANILHLAALHTERAPPLPLPPPPAPSTTDVPPQSSRNSNNNRNKPSNRKRNDNRKRDPQTRHGPSVVGIEVKTVPPTPYPTFLLPDGNVYPLRDLTQLSEVDYYAEDLLRDWFLGYLLQNPRQIRGPQGLVVPLDGNYGHQGPAQQPSPANMDVHNQQLQTQTGTAAVAGPRNPFPHNLNFYQPRALQTYAYNNAANTHKYILSLTLVPRIGIPTNDPDITELAGHNNGGNLALCAPTVRVKQNKYAIPPENPYMRPYTPPYLREASPYPWIVQSTYKLILPLVQSPARSAHHIITMVVGVKARQDTISVPELKAAVRVLVELYQRSEYADRETIAVLVIAYLGPKTGRISQVYHDGKKLIVQCSKLFDFDDPNTAPISLFVRYTCAWPEV